MALSLGKDYEVLKTNSAIWPDDQMALCKCCIALAVLPSQRTVNNQAA